jgi:hypothetical protein
MTGGQKGDLNRGESQPAAIPIKAQAIATLVEGQHVIAAWEQEQRL